MKGWVAIFAFGMMIPACAGWAQEIDGNVDFQSYQDLIIGGIGDYSHLESIDEGTMRADGALAATDTTTDAGQAFAIGGATASARASVDLSDTNLSASVGVVNPEEVLGIGFTEGSEDGTCEPGEFQIPGEEGEFRYCEQRYQDVVVLTNRLEVEKNVTDVVGSCRYKLEWRGATHDKPDGGDREYQTFLFRVKDASCTHLSVPNSVNEALVHQTPTYAHREVIKDVDRWMNDARCRRTTNNQYSSLNTSNLNYPGGTHNKIIHWDCNRTDIDYVEHWIQGPGYDDLDETCFVPEMVCVDGPRIGNTRGGDPVFLSCWEREAIATCTAGGSLGESSCGTLQAQPECGLVRSTCTVYDISGTVCIEEEVQYYCTTPVTDAPELNTQCHSTEVCVSGFCETHADDGEDSGFLDAMTTLIVLDEAVEDTDEVTDASDIDIFAGELQTCRIQQLAGALNCCSDSGWTNDLINDCNQEEVSLEGAVNAGAASHVDTRCRDRTIFGCFEKERRYCNFQSLMARIIQEEGRRQLGQSITESCAGFTGEEFGQLDLTQIDLSPIYGEAITAADLFDGGSITDTLTLRLNTSPELP